MSPYFIISLIIIFSNIQHTTNTNNSLIAKIEQMNWNDIVQDEDFIIKALEKLQKDLQAKNKEYQVNTTLKFSSTPTTRKYQHSQQKTSTPKSRKLLDILLNGTIEEIKHISHGRVLKSLPTLKNINISWDKKQILWRILTDNINASKISVNILEDAHALFESIPEDDLYNLNISDQKMLQFLGTFPGLTRRKAAILAYKLKNVLELNSTKILHPKHINLMRGLLCGFPIFDLAGLNALEVWKINDEVFHNLWACDERQLNTIFASLQREFQISRIELWTAKVIRKLGLLLRVIEPAELKLLEPELFRNISLEVFRGFSEKQCKALSSDQVKFLGDGQLVIYNSKVQ